GAIPETGEGVVFEAYVLSRGGKIFEGSRRCVCYVYIVENGRED
ncbi:hypothetical protein A2U01_0116087, partial [Trifolium medium]|nr:hypothetical protein [Trifolium medium]